MYRIRPSGKTLGVFSVKAARREHPDIVAPGIAAEQDGARGKPAADIALAAGRAERDAAVRQIGWLDVVPRAIGQLAQLGRAEIDFVQMVMMRPASAVGEQDPLSVVMDLGIADGSARIVEQDFELPCSHVEQQQPTAIGAVEPVVGIDARVAEVCVVVLLIVPARGSFCEHDPLHTELAESLQQPDPVRQLP